MKYYSLIIAITLGLRARTAPTPELFSDSLLIRTPPEPVPEAKPVEFGGALRYQSIEEWNNPTPPSKEELNEQSRMYYDQVQQAHDKNPDRADRKKPNVVAVHFHAKRPGETGPPGHLAYSSTMSLDPAGKGMPQPKAYVETAEASKQQILAKPKDELGPGEKKLQGQLKAGKTSIAHHTQHPKTVSADPHENIAKCAEAGTCSLIEQKYGKSVDMLGDKVSAYGTHGDLGQKGLTTGHLAACTKANHKQFNCNGVAAVKGLDDVNRPDRPDSSLSNSPKPATPITTPKRPLSPSRSNRSPSPPPPKTPKHYEQATISSQAKQKAKVTKGVKRRALLRREYLVRRATEIGIVAIAGSDDILLLV